MSAATPSQCLAILARHAREEVGPLRLQELCTDAERVNSLVEVHNRSPSAVDRYERSLSHLQQLHQQHGTGTKRQGGSAGGTSGSSYAGAGAATATPSKRHRTDSGESPYFPSAGSIDTSDHSNRLLLVDLSRHRMTLDTVNHLLRLARSRDIRSFIRTLAWGWNDRRDPVVPLRSRKGHGNSGGGGSVSGGSVGGGSYFRPDLSRDGSRESGASRHARFAEDIQDNTPKERAADNNITGVGSGVVGGSASFADPAISGAGGLGGVGGTMRTSPSMHLALRAPAGAGVEMYLPDGTNALDSIHATWDRIMRLSDSIRRGKLRSASGKVIRDVVVVGRGVPVAGLKFMYDALRRDTDAARAAMDGLTSESSLKAAAADGASRLAGRSSGSSKEMYSRRMRFVQSVDPAAAVEAISDLKPGSTLCVTIVGARGDEETMQASDMIKRWLLAGLGHNRQTGHILDRHMILVTGDERLAQMSKPECTFLMPQYARCEAFTTFTAASLVPLSIVYGWNIVERVLAGAHDMDSHFVETNPRHNLPVLLALSDLWNDAFLKSSGRIVTPFTDAFSSYPSFLAAIEAQTCGKGPVNSDRSDRWGNAAPSATIIDGGKAGVYDRVVYQGGRPMTSELLLAMDTQASSPFASRILGPEGAEDAMASHDDLVCSFFAHADVLALGSVGSREETSGRAGSSTSVGTSFDSSTPRGSPRNGIYESDDQADGNRPSTLLICGACDAFTCGQLAALAEHRAVISAKLWDNDPFAAFAPSHGTSLRTRETDRVKQKLHQLYERLARGDYGDEEQEFLSEGTKLNQATSTILWAYASRMKDQKMYVVDS